MDKELDSLFKHPKNDGAETFKLADKELDAMFKRPENDEAGSFRLADKELDAMFEKPQPQSGEHFHISPGWDRTIGQENIDSAVAFGKGFTHNFDEYAATFNKAMGKLTKTILPKKYQTTFFEDNARFWDEMRKRNEAETKGHEIAKLAGEIILDPINLTPAGVVSKGGKLARVAKSAALGAPIGYAASAVKNYGNSDMTEDRKAEQNAQSAMLVSALNGVIATLTKGKVKNAVQKPEDLETPHAKAALEALKNDPEAFGLKRADVQKMEEMRKPVQTGGEPDRELLSKMAEVAVKEPEPVSLPALMARTKEGVETPIGKLHIDFDYFLNKSTERDGGKRAQILHLIEPTLREPAFIVKHRDSFNFIKPFVDEGGKVKKFLSVVSDRSGRVKMVTSYRAMDKNILKILREGTVIEDFVRGTRSPALLPRRADLEGPKAGNPMDDIIPQNRPDAQKLFANPQHNLAGGFAGGTANAFDEMMSGEADTNRDGVISDDEIAMSFLQGMAVGAFGVSAIKAFRKRYPEAADKILQYFKENDIKPGDDLSVKLGVFAGKRAKGFDEAAGAGKVFDGKYDGMPRFEIDDSGARLKIDGTKYGTLGDVLHHPRLFEEYPELKDVATIVEVDKNLKHQRGSYTPHEDRGPDYFPIDEQIEIYARTPEEAQSMLLHEIQHAVQNREGFARGGSLRDALMQVERKIYDLEQKGILSDFDALNYKEELNRLKTKKEEEAFDIYRKIAGEIEAREVQARQYLTPEERELIPPYEDMNTMADRSTPEQYHAAVMARLDGRHKDFGSAGIAPEEATVDLSAQRADHAKELEDRYLNRQTDRVLEGALMKEAEPLPKPKSFNEFVKDFGTSGWSKVKTPIGNIEINVDYAYRHFTDNTHFQNRRWLTGALKRLLEDPLFVVKNPTKKQIEFYKPFKDENGVVHYIGIAKDNKGRLRYTTSFDKENIGQIKKMIKSTDGNLLYFKHSRFAQEGETVIGMKSATGEGWERGNVDEIIPQNDNGVKIGAFFGDAPKTAPKAKKDSLDHLRRLVHDEVNREWKDISSSLKGHFRLLFTDTFSGKYHQARDMANANKQKGLQKAELLHTALSKLPEDDRKLLHEYIVGDVPPESVPESIRAIGENVRATVRDVQKRLIDAGFSEEMIEAWGENYLKRLYEIHQKDDDAPAFQTRQRDHRVARGV